MTYAGDYSRFIPTGVGNNEQDALFSTAMFQSTPPYGGRPYMLHDKQNQEQIKMIPRTLTGCAVSFATFGFLTGIVISNKVFPFANS